MRKDRVASLLERELATIITQDLNDPRLHFVTVTTVSVSVDIKNATVYFSSLSDRKEMLKVLQGAKGYIRTLLAKRIRLKAIPDLVFKIDDTFERGQHIDELFKKISSDDKKE